MNVTLHLQYMSNVGINTETGNIFPMYWPHKVECNAEKYFSLDVFSVFRESKFYFDNSVFDLHIKTEHSVCLFY